MTLDEATNSIGRAVVYVPTQWGIPVEEGVITSTNDRYVFVRYGADKHSKATDPALLEFVARSAE